MIKQCPLCNQPFADGQPVTALLVARYIQKEEGNYGLEVSRQAILSHLVCPAL